MTDTGDADYRPLRMVWWRWESRDDRDEIQTYGRLLRASDTDPDALAAEEVARMLLKVEPCYERLCGYEVRVWQEDDPTVVGVSPVDEWLAILRQGVYANRQARVRLRR